MGPPAEVLELAGNKVAALEAARKAGVPVLKSSQPSKDLDELIAAADEIGFPIFAKAVAGGGGRGMRRVDTREALPEALQAAMREADAAFGDPTMFLEQAVLRPRHIEVQILADAEGNVMHLFERDCSIQRRHQKVIEIAPAPNLDEGIRQALYRDAVKFAKALNYVNAGTVEFLVDTVGERAGQHVFIEMNPRIQVEHTVTEEVTDVDLVQAQLRIASGETLADLGLSQETVQLKGAALQCRITTEDPANGFRPDVGKITGYRSAGGAGVRLDGGTVYSGAEISPHFDSMLVKLTCRGRDYPAAVARARRALAEFRIRGVSTNISFLQAVLDDADFIAGNVATYFIDERPELLKARVSADRGTKLLTWLAEVTVNKPNGELTVHSDPAAKLPAAGRRRRPAHGLPPAAAGAGPGRLRQGPARADAVAVTDTTFRDAHQSLLATRVRTRDLVAAGPAVSTLLPGAALRRGLGRRHLRRGPALPRRGPLGPAGRTAQGPAERLPADAAPRPQHGRLHPVPGRGHGGLRQRGRRHRHRHLPHLRCAQRRQPDGAGHPRRPRHRHGRRRGGTVLHRRTCWTRTRSSTRWTTTWSWPRRSSTPARTSWRSRTWPGCCAPPPPPSWCRPCANASTSRSTCTPTTPPAASWPPCWQPSTPAWTPWTWPPPRWPAPPASPPPRPWWPPWPTPRATPG